MTFLETRVLVGALLEKRPERPACCEALEGSEAPFTDPRALAEKSARANVLETVSSGSWRAFGESLRHHAGFGLASGGNEQVLL